MMAASSSKVKIFLPNPFIKRLANKAPMRELLDSQLDILTDEELEADPSRGKDIKVAWNGPGMLEYFERGLLPDLKLVCSLGAGVDKVPLDRLKKAGLRLVNTPGVVGNPTADMAIGLMIASGRRFNLGMKRATDDTFGENLPQPDMGLFHDISDSTLGIVGMGDVGYRIAKRARAFNMTIMYHNRNRKSTEEESAVDAIYYSSLHSMLPLCDFVVISCPLTSETTNLFTMKEFKVMKSTAHIINVARGKIVNTDDLVVALKSNVIAAAALDVTDPEPLPKGHPLLHLENAIVLPHWGAMTMKAAMDVCQLAIDNTKAFIEGKPLLTEYKFQLF